MLQLVDLDSRLVNLMTNTIPFIFSMFINIFLSNLHVIIWMVIILMHNH